ncbi:MAG: hypothetical protein IJN92_10590 [Lachnospiraceae bacterium]|nr:hypothetical protein [Lachnospiraceae bacterium]
MSLSENSPILSEKDNNIEVIGNGYDNMVIAENNNVSSDNYGYYEILVENTDTIIEQNREISQILTGLTDCGIYIVLGLGLVFGAICTLILNNHISRSVK